MAKRIRGAKEKLWCTKRDAKKRGISWQIKDADALALFTQPCRYCESEPQPFNGIDRLNNEKFYRKSNSVPCCWTCNRAKSAMKEMEWIGLCSQTNMVQHEADIELWLAGQDEDEARREYEVLQMAEALRGA
jgi:hypothetical protein